MRSLLDLTGGRGWWFLFLQSTLHDWSWLIAQGTNHLNLGKDGNMERLLYVEQHHDPFWMPHVPKCFTQVDVGFKSSVFCGTFLRAQEVSTGSTHKSDQISQAADSISTFDISDASFLNARKPVSQRLFSSLDPILSYIEHCFPDSKLSGTVLFVRTFVPPQSSWMTAARALSESCHAWCSWSPQVCNYCNWPGKACMCLCKFHEWRIIRPKSMPYAMSQIYKYIQNPLETSGVMDSVYCVAFWVCSIFLYSIPLVHDSEVINICEFPMELCGQGMQGALCVLEEVFLCLTRQEVDKTELQVHSFDLLAS